MKKIFILCLILILFFSSTNVFANDVNETNLAMDTEVSVVEDTDNSNIFALSENDLLETSSGTFTELQNKINNASEGSTITLENDYIYDNGFDGEGISISKTLTIQGNGHSIDALKQSRIFKITASNIVLTNLTFKNGYSNSGGAIYVSGGSSNHSFDCYFVNNSANYGGAVYFNTVSEGNKFYGFFVNNSANNGGAIVFHSGLNNCIFNASFYNNIAKGSGGAIDISGDPFNNIFDGYFVNNSAKDAGGALYLPLLSGSFIQNKFVGVFVNNSAGDIGGAVYMPGGSYNEFSGTYIGNSARIGGALGIFSMSQSNIINGNFYRNRADNGGAVYICVVYSENNLFDNDIFENNLAKSGSAIYIRDEIEKTLVIKNSIFINNINGTIINSNIGFDFEIDNCWFGNAANNYDIAPNVNENVHITNWLFLNATADPIKILTNNNSIIIFSLSNSYDVSSKETRNVESELPEIYLNILYKNGIVDKELVSLDENITYILTSGSEGEIICNYNGIEQSIIIKCLDNVSLIAPNISIYYGEYKRFNITLTENNIPLINETIIIKVNNQKYPVVTDNKGQASIDLDLDVGIHNVICEYYGLAVSSNYIVDNADSSLLIMDVNGTVGHEITLTAGVVSSNNLTVNEGTVTFFDGETNIGQVNVKDGIATLSYVPTNSGEHTITAAYNSNNYLSSNSTVKMLVDSASVEVLANPCIVGFNSTFVANVKGLYSIINEGSVSFYIDDEFIGKVDVVDGSARLVYTPLMAGDYVVKAVFSDSDNFLDDETNATYVVNKADSSLVIGDVKCILGHEVILSAKVFSSNNLTVKGIVSFFDGETSIGSSNLVNGVFSLSYTPATAGEHTITAVYKSDNYLSSNNTCKLLVDSASVEVLVNEGAFGFNSTFVVNVKGLYSIINEGAVSFYINDEFIGKVDVVEGSVKLVYTPVMVGDYVVKAVFSGSDNFLDDEGNTHYIVNKADSSLVIEDVNGILGCGLILSAKVFSFNNLIINEGFVTYFDGETIIGYSNVENGTAKLNYVPDTAGNHVITAVYYSDNYLNSNSSLSINIDKLSTSIISSAVTTVYNGGKYLVIMLEDVDGHVIDDVNLTVVLNGNTYTRTTDANGQVKVSTDGLAPVKTYSATITFDGNNNYEKSDATVNVTVKKATPKLTAKTKTFKKSLKTKKYTITLKNNKNKVMKNKKVTIKVNKKTYTAKTNSKGVATFKITKLTKKGTFKSTVTYKGDKYYNKVTKKVNIKVK